MPSGASGTIGSGTSGTNRAPSDCTGPPSPGGTVPPSPGGTVPPSAGGSVPPSPGDSVPPSVGGLRWSLMFFLLTPITFVMSLDRTAITVAAPTIQHEYGFTLAEMSLILTRFSWPCSALRVPGG